MVSKEPLTPFWLAGWAVVMSIAWLLPNHYPPWSTFHMDAWASAIMGLASAAVFLRIAGPIQWHCISLVAFAVVFIPALQYAFGLIVFAGIAWISIAYLLGFALAMLMGAQWEMADPGKLGDGLFLAIGIAALLSVGLQLHQWLALDLLGVWSMGDGFGRPFANFGQANQLGTFLMWGLLAAVWAYVRRQIGFMVATIMSMFLLFGIALTQSRTAWIAGFILIFASWYWRRLWSDRRVPWVATCLGIYFCICIFSLGWLSQFIHLSVSSDIDLARISGELRPTVWAMFVDAAGQQPIFGFGWNQVVLAQLTASLGYPALQTVFSHSHNIFLDLILWCGVPIGISLSVYLASWLFRRVKQVANAEDAILVLLLLVVANHALLELPLHHAYFLLPVGLVMGALNVRNGVPPVAVLGRWSAIVVWMLAATLLTLIVRDYSRIEASYQMLRFEWAGVKINKQGTPPEVLLLNQWREFIILARFEPTHNMNADQIEWMRKIAAIYPSSGALHKLAAALAMNKQPEEARLWLRRACKIVTESQCLAIKAAWARQSVEDSDIAKVLWPN